MHIQLNDPYLGELGSAFRFLCCCFYIFITRVSLFILGIGFCVCLCPLCFFVLVDASTGALDCMERLISVIIIIVIIAAAAATTTT